MENHIHRQPLEPYWDIHQCTIEKNTDGGFTLVDHGIQCSVVSGTEEEVTQFAKAHGYTFPVECEL
jgi:hypothetical protein